MNRALAILLACLSVLGGAFAAYLCMRHLLAGGNIEDAALLAFGCLLLCLAGGVFADPEFGA